MLGLRADRETAFHAFISIFPLPILTIMSSNVEYRKEFGEDVGNMFTQTSLSLSLSLCVASGSSSIYSNAYARCPCDYVTSLPHYH